MNAPASVETIADVLQQAGWLAAKSVFSPPIQCGTNLLPLIHESLDERAEHSNERLNVLQWIEAAQARDAQLLVWPLRHASSGGPARLLWCPCGSKPKTKPKLRKPRRRIAVLSSHLGQRPDELREWFQLLRQIVQERRIDEQLITARGTTAHPWLECAAADSTARTLVIECPTVAAEKRGPLKWLTDLVRTPWTDATEVRDTAILSPALRSIDEVIETCLLGDQALLQLADEVYVLRLLKRGRLRHVLDKHLLDHISQPPVIRLAIGERLVPADLATSLVERGCRIWPHVELAGPPRQLKSHSLTIVDRSPVSPAETAPLLTHWTRAANGPWPDQTIEQFRHDLVFDQAAAERGALATLLRILAMRRLCASTQAIRGGHPVVCFTAIPFEELSAHRVYRRHRRRWDFCPYGISISQEWLAAHGARPVIYGDWATWEHLETEERPYFQLNGLRGSSRAKTACDWRREREWRVVGDVDLSKLPADQAWLFVPTPLEARWVSLLSRWPVRVMDATAPVLSRPSELAQ